MRATVLASSLLVLAGCAGDAVETWEPPVAENAAPLAAESRAPEGTARGILGGYEHGRVWGWAQVVGDPDPVEVRIDVDGEPVATVLADRFRRDLLDKAVHPTGHAGFELVIDELPRGAEVDATIVATDTPLTHGPCVVRGAEGVSSCTEGQPRGILGGHREGVVWGWAHVQGRAEPVHVRIEVDGEPVATVAADQMRHDLVAKRIHRTGKAGFRADVGPVGESAELAAYIDGEGFRLPASARLPARRD